jgi:hypothetical protein
MIDLGFGIDPNLSVTATGRRGCAGGSFGFRFG